MPKLEHMFCAVGLQDEHLPDKAYSAYPAAEAQKTRPDETQVPKCKQGRNAKP